MRYPFSRAQRQDCSVSPLDFARYTPIPNTGTAPPSFSGKRVVLLSSAIKISQSSSIIIVIDFQAPPTIPNLVNMGKDNDKSGEKKPRPKRIFARIVNGILIVVYFALLLLSLLSIGFFAATVNRINGAVSSQGIQGCLLYSDNILNNSGACGFVTWGQAIVLVFALAFMAYLVIKILAGFKL